MIKEIKKKLIKEVKNLNNNIYKLADQKLIAMVLEE